MLSFLLFLIVESVAISIITAIIGAYVIIDIQLNATSIGIPINLQKPVSRSERRIVNGIDIRTLNITYFP